MPAPPPRSTSPSRKRWWRASGPTIPNLRNQLEQELIGLGILVGRPPEAIDVRPGSLDTLSLPLVAPGLPSSLLARRPDVAEAEAQLIAANFDIQVARAAFFPTIQLTGSGRLPGGGVDRAVRSWRLLRVAPRQD